MMDRPQPRSLRKRRAAGPDPILLAALGQLQPGTLEAIWLGALLTIRLSDGPPVESAHAINAAFVHLRLSTIELEAVHSTIHASGKTDQQALAHRLDVHALRHALIHELKLRIGYVDAKGRATQRTVWPIDIEDYGPNGAMLAWCEKRQDFRNFRFDRVTRLAVLPERTDAPRQVMRALFAALLADEAEP
jgi:predicted DNA-binding transcriptional regulator YafY